jgi:hypothetical protein
MTWAKIVDDEVVQIFEGDPRNHWHPDALVYWEDVPDDIGIAIGWHRREDGTWADAETWQAEDPLLNMAVDPGPPSCNLMYTIDDDAVNNTVIITATAEIAGDYDEDNPEHVPSWSWNDGDNTSNEWEVTITVTKDPDAITQHTFSCSVVGTGGTSETEEVTVNIPRSA